MRQWMVDTEILCTQHLLGEHYESHLTLGALKKGTSVKGYIAHNLLEPNSLLSRHNELAQEISKRNHKKLHNSPLNLRDELNQLSPQDRNTTINKEEALKELLSRCPKCRANYEQKAKHMQTV